jgi:hypothetical protein
VGLADADGLCYARFEFNGVDVRMTDKWKNVCGGTPDVAMRGILYSELMTAAVRRCPGRFPRPFAFYVDLVGDDERPALVRELGLPVLTTAAVPRGSESSVPLPSAGLAAGLAFGTALEAEVPSSWYLGPGELLLFSFPNLLMDWLFSFISCALSNKPIRRLKIKSLKRFVAYCRRAVGVPGASFPPRSLGMEAAGCSLQRNLCHY